MPRVSDLSSLIASTAGKIEIESVGDVREEKVMEKLVQGAVLAAWNRRFSLGDFDDVVTRFHNGLVHRDIRHNARRWSMSTRPPT